MIDGAAMYNGECQAVSFIANWWNKFIGSVQTFEFQLCCFDLLIMSFLIPACSIFFWINLLKFIHPEQKPATNNKESYTSKLLQHTSTVNNAQHLTLYKN